MWWCAGASIDDAAVSPTVADQVHPSTGRTTHLWTSCVYRWWMCARLGGVRVEVDVVQVVSDAVFVLQFSPAGHHCKFAGPL